MDEKELDGWMDGKLSFLRTAVMNEAIFENRDPIREEFRFVFRFRPIRMTAKVLIR